MPHIAGSTNDMRKRVGFELLEDIKSYLTGEKFKNQVLTEQASRMSIEKGDNL